MDRIEPALIFAAVTVLIWIARLRNIWGDGNETFTTKVAWTVPVVVFFMLAALLVRAWLVPNSIPHFLGAVRLLAGWTVLYWLFRSLRLLGGGHSFGFVFVHLVLAAISIGLAAWSWPRQGAHQGARMGTLG